MIYKQLFIYMPCTVFLAGCKPKDPILTSPVNNLKNKWLVLNEGLFQHNNSSISILENNGSFISNAFFTETVGRPLGDTGNDMKQYGGKIYIVVNVSSTIEVLDAATGKSIKHIPFSVDNQAKQPRSIDFYNGKAFVSCFDGFVDVVDTTTLSVIARIPVGNNPDQLKVVGDKLYVSNSGGLNFPNVDSTLSVVSLTSFSEIKRVIVGQNPGSLAVGSNGDLYVVARGNFGSVPSRLVRIETENDTKVEEYNFDAEFITEMNGDILVLEANGQPTLKLFEISSNSLSFNDLFALSDIVTPYKVQFISASQSVVVFDANGYVNTGKLHVYKGNGAFLWKANVGLVPSSVLAF